MKQNYSSTSNSTLDAIANSVLENRFSREKNDASLLARRGGITPDSWQGDLLRSDARQMILNCSRAVQESV